MARQYENLGSGDLVPTVNRNATPDVSRVQPGDWSVLGLVDGRRSLEAICAAAVMAEADAARSLARLLSLGMIHLPRPLATPVTVPSSGPSSIRPSRASVARDGRKSSEKEVKVNKGAVRLDAPTGWPVPLDRFAFDPASLTEPVDIPEAKQRQIIYYHHHLQLVSYYDLFQVPRDADVRTIRHAYFKLSKEFHPDQFFRRSLGSFELRISEVFKWVSGAYMVLSDNDKRKAYDAVIARGHAGDWAVPKLSASSSANDPTTAMRGVSAQMPAIGSQELCQQGERKLEEGDFPGALRLFETVLKSAFDGRTAILAAQCLVEMNSKLDVADSYCRRAIKAGLDMRDKLAAYIVLARILERVGRTDDAMKVFLQARRLDPDNPAIRAHVDRLAQTRS